MIGSVDTQLRINVNQIAENAISLLARPKGCQQKQLSLIKLAFCTPFKCHEWYASAHLYWLVACAVDHAAISTVNAALAASLCQHRA